MAVDRQSTIQILYSVTAGNKPTPTDLELGELAVNTADGEIYFRGSDDSLKTVVSGERVESFNGLTGAVFGVSSVNGKTGDVDVVTGYTSGPDTPSSASTGDFWLETDTGDLFFYDGSSFIQISGADGATGNTGPVGDYVESFNGATGAVQGVSTVNGATGDVEVVSSYNGATGAIEKIYGCFYNSSATEFTSLTTIGVDSVMYNSDPSGLTLSSDRIQINKNGVFKITFDVSCGLTGGLPGTALQSKFDVYKKRGIFSPTVVLGTSAYHEMPRANPAASLQFTDTSSISMITPDHVSGDLYMVQGDLDVGTIGSGIFHVPANGYRITVEEL